MDSFVNIDGTDNLLVLKHYLVMHNLLSYIRPNQLGRSTRHNFGDDTCLIICRSKVASDEIKSKFSICYKDAMSLCYKPYQSSNLLLLKS